MVSSAKTVVNQLPEGFGCLNVKNRRESFCFEGRPYLLHLPPCFDYFSMCEEEVLDWTREAFHAEPQDLITPRCHLLQLHWQDDGGVAPKSSKLNEHSSFKWSGTRPTYCSADGLYPNRYLRDFSSSCAALQPFYLTGRQDKSPL